MADKGEPQSAAGAAAVERLLDDLVPCGDVTSRKMFGGYGVFHEGTMFAIVDGRGDAYLRADEPTSVSFEATGSSRHGTMPYWSIPEAVRCDDAQLVEWARRSITIAHSSTP